MKRYTSLLTATALLAALSPLQTHAADNTWNNAFGNSSWDLTSPNWGSPTIWVNNDNAFFCIPGSDPSGLTSVTLGVPVTAHNITVTGTNYMISGGGNALTLAGATPTISAIASSNSFAVSISGTDGLTFKGGINVLLGDALQPDANHYTGGTFVRSGTLILRAAGVSASGTAYAVDTIEAIDTGATVQIGTVNDGASNVRPADGQIKRLNGFGRLNLTGGTFDNNGDNNGIIYPPPSGTGTIVNSSPYIRAVMKLQGTDGSTYVFNGKIKDGGPNVTTSQGIAYQENVDMNSGSYTMVWGGSNSFTGFLRMNNPNHKVILQPGGTLGYPAPINCPARQILMNSGFIDLNGTSQKTGYIWTKRDTDGCIITNSAIGTLSTLTLCYNCTNTTVPTTSGSSGGISNSLKDDPATGGTLGITKEGTAIQVIGDTVADVNNNYHGDTVVNNGILDVVSTGAISPNSAYRLNTTQGTLQLDYSGTANVRQLWIDGVPQPNGVYGSGNTTAITGGGTLTVTGYDFDKWNNGSANSFWDLTSANWTSPAVWGDANSALFTGLGANPSGAGTDVTVNSSVAPYNIAVLGTNYNFIGQGNSITLASPNPVITSYASSNTIGASINGTNGVTFNGNGTTVLAGDVAVPDGNHYTGGTYVRSGTVILQAAGASSGGSAYAVDSIEALDEGATVRMGSTFDGTTWFSAPRDQIAASVVGTRLHMTGGTLDLYNDPKTQRIPVPEGTGLIINNGSAVQAGVIMIADGLDHEFAGVIADGNNGVLVGDNSGQGPGYQIGIVQFAGSKNGGGGELTLSGHNTYSGSTRIDQNASIKLAGEGTIGFPTPNGLTGPLRIYGSGHLDLNGHNQTIANMQNGAATAQVYNTAAGTVSTLTFGYGNEAVSRTCSFQFKDNPGTGGILALTKVGHGNPQTLNGVNTYSGDTTITDGNLILSADTAVSPASAYHLSTSATLSLTYSGSANVRQLWIDGIQQPNGVYGAGTPGIDAASTGTLTVTAADPRLVFSKSGNTLTLSWVGSGYKLQYATSLTGIWCDYPAGGISPVPVTIGNGSQFFRLTK